MNTLISAAELLSALVTYEASLSAGSAVLLPVPSRREGRPVWVILAADMVKIGDSEQVGPVRGVRIVDASDGATHDEPYGGPDLPAVKRSAESHLRQRLRLEITGTADGFFAGRPTHATWMRVALRDAFPGDLILALASVAPDFLAWLADSPSDRV